MTVIQDLTKVQADDEKGADIGLVVGLSMENISAHGIPNIKRAQYPSRRLLWMGAFLLSFSMCVWQVCLLTEAYISRLITTNTEVRVATTLIFPAVTICNMNGMRLSYLNSDEDLYYKIMHQAEQQENEFMEWTDSDLESREGYFDMISSVTEHLATMPYDEREVTGHKIDKAMLSCNFNGYPCLPTNFSFSYNYLYGNCYTFNSGRTYQISNTSYAGPLYGLTLEMNVEQHEYISSIQPAAGLRILVHDQNEMPFPEDQGITVAPGRETSIGVYRTEYQRLPHPYPSECQDSTVETLFSRRFPHIEYSKQACMKDCIYDKTFEHCGCYNSRYVFDDETKPICTVTNSSQEECILDAEKKIGDGSIHCDCRPACEEVAYKTSTSSSIWPGIRYLPTIVRKVEQTSNLDSEYYVNDTESYIEQNFAKVNIYYENLQYDSIEQVATYTLLSLISNIGGHLGLWIGMSALTILELLESTYDIMKHALAATIRRKRAKKFKNEQIKSGNQPRTAFQNDAFSQKQL